MSQHENNIKTRGNAYALQCTRTARTVGLVNDDVEPADCADIYQIAIGDLVLAFDTTIPESERAEIVTGVARELETIGPASRSKMQREGNGFQLNLSSDVVEHAWGDLTDANDPAGMKTGFSGVPHRDEDDGGGEIDRTAMQMMVIYPRGTDNKTHAREALQLRAAQVEGEDDA